MREMVLDGAVSVLSLVILGAYLWSVRSHFTSQTTPKGARVISAVVTLSAIFLFRLTWTLSQPVWAQLVGLTLQGASAVLFGAAVMASRAAQLKFVFDSAAPQSLLQTGPYKFVRHPFYVSYIIFWTGWAIATWSLLALICVGILVALYVFAARREEASFNDTPLAESYLAYKQRTGFFLPRLS